MQDIDQPESKADIRPSPGLLPRFRKSLPSLLSGLGSGLVASLTSVALMLFLRLVAGTPTPVELFSYFTLKRLDAGTFVGFLVRFSPNSKTTPLGLALLGMIALGVILAALYAAIVRVPLPAQGYRPSRREWLTAVGFGLAMTLIGCVLFWDELRQNLYGYTVDQERLFNVLALLADFLVFAVVLCLGYRALLPKIAPSEGNARAQGRRALLSRAGVAALGLGAGLGTAGMLSQYLDRYTSYDGASPPPHNGFTPPITPNSEHYIVTQNVIDPTPTSGNWKLDVGGLFKQGGSYTYEDFQKLPSTSRAITLECISNPIGGPRISTAIWQGVSLKTLIDLHGGAAPDAKYVAFSSVDGYNMSLPLEEVLAVEALLAYRMNGEVLPQKHGYPIRVLIPGRYGEENPKWVNRVELTDHFVGGLYSDQGWYNGPLHTWTRIDRPQGSISVAGMVEVGGVAYGGSRGIKKVEISTDNGTTWNEATLQPPLSKDTWVLWSWPWRAPAPGRYTLMSRATDGEGNLQETRDQFTVPKGATGYHKVQVQVR